MSVVGTLAVRIVGDASNLNRTLNTSQVSIKKFGLAAGAALATAAGAFAAFTKNAINSMDQMSKLAQRSGVSVRAMSELAHAADLSGLSVEQLSQTFGILSRRLVEAQQGSASAQASFNALQLDPSQFQSADEALMAIAERFEQMPDGVEKTALASQMFGDRVGRQLIPFLNQGRSGLEDLRKEAQRLGVAFDDEAGAAAEQFNDNLARIGAVGRGVFYQIANAWLPTINNYIDAVFEASRQTDGWFRSLAAVALGGIPTTFDEFTTEIIRLESAIAKLRQAESEGTLLENFVDIESLEDRRRLLMSLAEIEEKRRQGLTLVTPDFAGLPPRQTGEQRQARDELAERLNAVKRLTQEYERERDVQLDLMRIQDEMAGMTNDEREVQEVINRVLQETSKNLEQIAAQRLEAANLGASQAILDQFDKEAAKIQELADEYVQLAETQKRAAIDAQRQFSFGWQTAFAQYAEDATNSAMVARDMFTSMTSNINTAIDNLVRNGKLSFSDFASSIIKDIIRIQLQAQISQAFSQILGVIGASLGNMFSGQVAAGASPLTVNRGMGYSGFAKGGYTGEGAQYEPAGIVHKGEFVLNAAATKRIGISNLERMNKGYANGGYVGSTSMAGGVNINIKNEAGADGYKATAQARTNSDGGLNIDVLVRRVISADIQQNGQLAQQMANTFGLRRAI